MLMEDMELKAFGFVARICKVDGLFAGSAEKQAVRCLTFSAPTGRRYIQ